MGEIENLYHSPEDLSAEEWWETKHRKGYEISRGAEPYKLYLEYNGEIVNTGFGAKSDKDLETFRGWFKRIAQDRWRYEMKNKDKPSDTDILEDSVVEAENWLTKRGGYSLSAAVMYQVEFKGQKTWHCISKDAAILQAYYDHSKEIEETSCDITFPSGEIAAPAREVRIGSHHYGGPGPLSDDFILLDEIVDLPPKDWWRWQKKNRRRYAINDIDCRYNLKRLQLTYKDKEIELSRVFHGPAAEQAIREDLYRMAQEHWNEFSI
jgi:hypothetical protein